MLNSSLNSIDKCGLELHFQPRRGEDIHPAITMETDECVGGEVPTTWEHTAGTSHPVTGQQKCPRVRNV